MYSTYNIILCGYIVCILAIHIILYACIYITCAVRMHVYTCLCMYMSMHHICMSMDFRLMGVVSELSSYAFTGAFYGTEHVLWL